jgi:hypothetical protein
VSPDEINVLALVGALVLFVASGLAWAYFRPYVRTLRAIRRAPRVPIAEVVDGTTVRIVGTIVAGKKMLAAPLTGRRCAHYKATLDELREHSSRHGGGQDGWDERARQEDARNFIVEDETGRALVRLGPKGIESALVLDHASILRADAEVQSAEEAAFLEAQRIPRNARKRTLRLREGVLEAGEDVAVLGRARWEQDGRAGAAKHLVIEPMPDGKVYASDDPSARWQ